MDYGTLMCWADNAVGQQKEPCVFHIIAAGKPDSPYNCTLINQTSDGLEVDCNEGKYQLKCQYKYDHFRICVCSISHTFHKHKHCFHTFYLMKHASIIIIPIFNAI